jgi:hypothetical protein
LILTYTLSGFHPTEKKRKAASALRSPNKRKRSSNNIDKGILIPWLKAFIFMNLIPLAEVISLISDSDSDTRNDNNGKRKARSFQLDGDIIDLCDD